MNKRKIFGYELLSAIGFFVMSASFLLMPFVDNSNGVNAFGMTVGLMFWLGLLIGICMQILIAASKKSIKKNQRIGLCSFMRNIYGSIADIVFIVSIVMLVIGIILTNQSGYICYIAISMLTFSFCMHCILNGKIFAYFISK